MKINAEPLKCASCKELIPFDDFDLDFICPRCKRDMLIR